jgi:hypothetical protein
MANDFLGVNPMIDQLAAWLGRIAIASFLWLGAFVYLIERVR